MASSNGPVIIDFGMACSSNVRAATPGYVPPEMETNRGRTVTLPFQKAADCYALGVIAHEIFTGKMPTDSVISD